MDAPPVTPVSRGPVCPPRDSIFRKLSATRIVTTYTAVQLCAVTQARFFLFKQLEFSETTGPETQAQPTNQLQCAAHAVPGARDPYRPRQKSTHMGTNWRGCTLPHSLREAERV